MFNSNGYRFAGSQGRLMVAGIAILAIGGCAHVNRDELTTELDQIRSEIRTGDEGVESRLTQDIQGVEGRVATMEGRLASLEGELRSLEGEFDVALERFESSIRFSAPVHFAFDDAAVRAADYPVLDRFASVVQGYYADATITVEGFTDPSGSVEYNLRLGQRRADSVMMYLASAGVPSDRMRAVSYGEGGDRLIVSGAQGPGEAGWQNRRVAMVIDFGPSGGQPSVALSGSADDL
jgi:peptidoglycan-associated lipoprotein